MITLFVHGVLCVTSPTPGYTPVRDLVIERLRQSEAIADNLDTEILILSHVLRPAHPEPEWEREPPVSEVTIRYRSLNGAIHAIAERTEDRLTDQIAVSSEFFWDGERSTTISRNPRGRVITLQRFLSASHTFGNATGDFNLGGLHLRFLASSGSDWLTHQQVLSSQVDTEVLRLVTSMQPLVGSTVTFEFTPIPDLFLRTITVDLIGQPGSPDEGRLVGSFRYRVLERGVFNGLDLPARSLAETYLDRSTSNPDERGFEGPRIGAQIYERRWARPIDPQAHPPSSFEPRLVSGDHVFDKRLNAIYTLGSDEARIDGVIHRLKSPILEPPRNGFADLILPHEPDPIAHLPPVMSTTGAQTLAQPVTRSWLFTVSVGLAVASGSWLLFPFIRRRLSG